MPAEVEEERRLVVPLGDLLDRMVAVEVRADLRWQRRDLVEQRPDLLLRQRVPHLGEVERKEIEQRHLGREGLRRGDAHLDPRARVEDPVDLLRDLRAHHVRDRQRPRAALAGQPQRVHRVARLARLGDADDEGVLRENRVAVAPFARDVGLARDAGPLLDDVAADDARVVGGAASRGRPCGGGSAISSSVRPMSSKSSRLATDALADRVRDRLRLLVDLLEHEGLVAVLLGVLVVPVDLEFRPARRGPSVDRDEAWRRPS